MKVPGIVSFDKGVGSQEILKLGGCHIELFGMICRLLPCRSGSVDLSIGANCFSHVDSGRDLN